MSNLTHKKKRSRKNGDEFGKALYKSINNAVYGKTIKQIRNRIDARRISSKKYYLIWTS